MSGAMQLLLGGTPVVPDPYFEYTTLLLPGNGTNGAQNNTFLDSSTNNFTITRSGNATQGTFSPFSQTGWSNYFDGSSYLTLASNVNLAIGTSDYTFECWIFVTTLTSGSNTVYGAAASGGPVFNLNLASGTISLNPYGSGAVFSTSFTFAVGNWYHVAFARASNSLKVFVNGAQVGATTTDSTNYSQTAMTVASAGGIQNFTAYISNLRFVKGTAVYTANFTPSTTPLTAISNTQLLTCQSNRFVDNSSNAFALTTTGSPSIQAFSPFNPTAAWSAATNGGSGYFDGSGDRVMTASTSAAFDLGSGNWTIEAWVYFTTVTSYATIAYCSLSNVDGHGLTLVTTSAFAYYINGSLAINSGVAPVAGRWYHVAAVRNSGTTTLYVNGVSTGTTASAPTSKNYYFSSGLKPNDIEPLTGYVSDARVVKGTAVYTANFTPPTAPLTAITNTSILCNFTNAGIFDATSKNDLETVGNAQISTTQSKFGGSSMYFDGTGDWLIGRTTDLASFGTGDFTIEGWLYPSAVTGTDRCLWDTRAATGDTGMVVFIDTNGKISTYTSGAIRLTSTNALSANTWQHFALCRYNGTMAVYINGIQNGTLAYSTTITCPGRISVAVRFDNAAPYTGYINDLRITKGVARYTANFTAPTAAFPLL